VLDALARGRRVGSTAWPARGTTRGPPWTIRPRTSGARC